ncbi:hypothetical protein J3F84DRAFT_199196 [Trichoderma pleuroticola]
MKTGAPYGAALLFLSSRGPAIFSVSFSCFSSQIGHHPHRGMCTECKSSPMYRYMRTRGHRRQCECKRRLVGSSPGCIHHVRLPRPVNKPMHLTGTHMLAPMTQLSSSSSTKANPTGRLRLGYEYVPHNLLTIVLRTNKLTSQLPSCLTDYSRPLSVLHSRSKPSALEPWSSMAPGHAGIGPDCSLSCHALIWEVRETSFPSKSQGILTDAATLPSCHFRLGNKF